MNLDLQIFQQLHSLAGQSSLGDAVIIFCAKPLIFIVGGALLIYLIIYKKWGRAVLVGASVFLARGVVVEIIRYFYYRPRPFVALHFTPLIEATKVLDTFNHEGSFPSGHAAIGFAMVASVYFFNKKVAAWMGFVIIFVVLARVISGVHYPSDILVGALVGFLSAFVVEKAVSWRFIKKLDFLGLLDSTGK
jgi:undecaprenyl-diphosphatase